MTYKTAASSWNQSVPIDDFRQDHTGVCWLCCFSSVSEVVPLLPKEIECDQFIARVVQTEGYADTSRVSNLPGIT